jgi:hypothetical protein
MDAFKAVWNQLFKDFEKMPGWVPLYVLIVLFLWRLALPDRLLEWVNLPDHIPAWGWARPLLSREIVAAALTALFYTIGNAIDEGVFKTGPEEKRETRDLFKARYATAKNNATEAIGVGKGIYSVALRLNAAGEKLRHRMLIHAPNEAAKCLRALIVPLAGLGIFYWGWRGRPWLALVSEAGVLSLFLFYPMLKCWHIRLLYSAACALTEKAKYDDQSLNDKIRLVFWDYDLIGSGEFVNKISKALGTEHEGAPPRPASKGHSI